MQYYGAFKHARQNCGRCDNDAPFKQTRHICERGDNKTAIKPLYTILADATMKQHFLHLYESVMHRITGYFYKSSSFITRRRNYRYSKNCEILIVFTTQTKQRNCTMYWNTVYKYKCPMDFNLTTLTSLNKIKSIRLYLHIFIQTYTETNPVLKDDTVEYILHFFQNRFKSSWHDICVLSFDY